MAEIAAPPITVHEPRSPHRRAVRRFLANPSALIGLVLVLLALACALFAAQITPYDPIRGDLSLYVKPPSPDHLFGTDDIGRDIFTRVIHGARISLKIALLAQAASLSIGLIFGLITGYYGGLIDTLIMRLVDVIMSFPLLIIAIALVSALGANENNIIFALAFVSWPFVTRLTRSQVLAVKEMEYITAARSLGAPALTIMLRHIVPNILTPLIVYATLGIGGTILSEAALSFIGLGGADQAVPSWGKMLTESRAFIRSAWWMPFYPGMAILLTVLGFNLLGDGLRDILDVRE
ncbi:MAG: ABC transporter permease [Anaerolinea sp.]|nr:ABC transporter permease [Anaerolinea sp.]